MPLYPPQRSKEVELSVNIANQCCFQLSRLRMCQMTLVVLEGRNRAMPIYFRRSERLVTGKVWN